MKNKKWTWIIIAIAVVAVAVGAWFLTRQLAATAKAFTVTVAHADGTSKDFSYTSRKENLGEALLKEGLITAEKTESGLNVQTIDGQNVIPAEEGAGWLFYVNGEYTSTPFDQAVLEDGNTYRLEYATELEQPGLVVNIDINTAVRPFLESVVALGNPTESDLYPFVDTYADTQVTDLAFCIFCQYSATPSEVWTDSVAKYEQKKENHFTVSYEKEFGAIYELYETHGLDPYRIWLKRCQENGIRGWLSLRMNDCHDADVINSFLRSDFFYEAKEKGWMIGNKFGYYRICYDYAVPEVRQKMLDYIAEQLRQYPEAGGLELDFMREAYCFSTADLPNAAAIMNDFIRQVRQLVKQIEQENGHEIPIMIRVPRDLETAWDFGFDVVTWAEEELCDVVVPCARWATTDSDMPIDQWKETLSDFPVYAGLEILTNRQHDDAYTNEEITRGYSHEYWSLGADKIYLFNLFTLPEGMDCPHLDYEEVIGIYQTCGSPETAKEGPRRFIVTYQDIAINEETRYQPLSIKVSAEESGSLTIATGKSKTPAKLVVVIREGGTIPQITCNGQECTYLGEAEKTPYLDPFPSDQWMAYELPAFSDVRQTLTFAVEEGDTTIRYLEVETE